MRTGTTINNLLPEDYTRVAGEVSTTTGKILADAHIVVVSPENLEKLKQELKTQDLKCGEALIKLPKGALQDPKSIFNTPEAQGLQDLKASVFIRPRTKEEFVNALPKKDKLIPSSKRTTPLTEDEESDAPAYEFSGTYVSTNAGTAEIMHNGKKVLIDKQGIDRYDHYNKLSEFSINLDDTRYYNQTFDAKREGKDLVTKIKANESKKLK